jgi:hypothetical protein
MEVAGPRLPAAGTVPRRPGREGGFPHCDDLGSSQTVPSRTRHPGYAARRRVSSVGEVSLWRLGPWRWPCTGGVALVPSAWSRTVCGRLAVLPPGDFPHRRAARRGEHEEQAGYGASPIGGTPLATMSPSVTSVPAAATSVSSGPWTVPAAGLRGRHG